LDKKNSHNYTKKLFENYSYYKKYIYKTSIYGGGITIFEKNSIIKALIWKILERVVAQGTSFIIQIILARLLFPKDFGVIAIVLVFIQIANVFIQGGLNTALIQKKNPDDLDYSTINTFSFLISVIIALLIFGFSKFIADFYQLENLKDILRVMSIMLLFGPINSVLNAFAIKNLMFSKLFWATFISSLVSGLISIIMAYNGYGVWALVIQQILNNILVAISLILLLKWYPKIRFSINRLRELLHFGWKILLAGILDTIYRNLSTLFIGKLYSTSNVGEYNRGNQIPGFIITNLNGSIQSVLFPVLANYQYDRVGLKRVMKRAMLISSYIVFPLMFGLIAVADNFVFVVLTDKWEGAIPYIRIFAAFYAIYPLHTSNLQAINALGRSDVFLRLELIKKIIGVSLLLISIQFGIYYIAWSMVISGFIAAFINIFPSKKFLNYGYKEQITDLLPIILISIAMSVMVYGLGEIIQLDTIYVFITQIFAGIVIYMSLSYLFKVDSYRYLIKIVVDTLSRYGKVNDKDEDGE
jgi:O-antigen/teichoic acid export membrane protein